MGTYYTYGTLNITKKVKTHGRGQTLHNKYKTSHNIRSKFKNTLCE